MKTWKCTVLHFYSIHVLLKGLRCKHLKSIFSKSSRGASPQTSVVSRPLLPAAPGILPTTSSWQEYNITFSLNLHLCKFKFSLKLSFNHLKQLSLSLPTEVVQKAPATSDIARYFPSFASYKSPVKRKNVGGKWCCYPLSAIYFLRSTFLKSF